VPYRRTVDGRIRDAAHAVDRALREAVPETYAGLVLSDSARTIEVRLTQLSPASRLVAEAEANGCPIRFIHVLNSLESLEGAFEHVMRASQDLKAEGIKLVGFGVDIQLNRVDLRVQDVTITVAKALSDRFGANLVYVRPGEPGFPLSDDGEAATLSLISPMSD